MNINKIIVKKSKGNKLTKNELFYIINGINKYVSDYQISSFLMAVKLKGFDDDELIWYTEALIISGKSLDFNSDLLDKHSTGGIGDKTTLILLPIFKELKINLLKISGKGLGFTGGTLDKLGFIENLNLTFSYKDMIDKFKKTKSLITGANEDFVPADSYIYSIRDTSGTVDSFELIAASIMSKKIVSGAKYIFIDIKVGTGAFVPNLKEGKKLARLIKKIADFYKREIFILFSDMNEPLGKYVGNSIELIEVIDFLKDYKNANKYLFNLISEIVIKIYSSYFNTTNEISKQKYYDVLNSGTLFNSFLEIIKNQNGDTQNIENNKFFKPKHKFNVYSNEEGYFEFLDLKKLGYFLIDLKAGRKNKSDKLYYYSGIHFLVKNNDFLNKNDLIAEIYSKDKLTPEKIREFESCFRISKNNVKHKKTLLWY